MAQKEDDHGRKKQKAKKQLNRECFMPLLCTIQLNCLICFFSPEPTFIPLHSCHTVYQITMSNNSSPRPAKLLFTKSMIWTPQAMVETVNNLLQPQAQAAWRELSTGEQLRAATMLLDTVEQGAFVLADNLLKTDIVQENTDNIREYTSRILFCKQSFACFALGISFKDIFGHVLRCIETLCLQ